MPEALWSDSRIGPYVLLGQLGGGGMGDVYLGRSRGGRLVAVKVVRPHLAKDPEFRRRFAVEVAAARQVGGFYTAMVVDADTTADAPWLATAYIPGPSLQEAVDAHGPLPVGTVAALGAGLAEGLTAIHSHGLVHRDLKPGNVIFAEDGPRIIDFGIARALDAATRLTAQGVIGTPAFMSPEQVTDGEAGTESDVFSLASLLVHAVTGRAPFGGGTTFAVLHRLIHEEPDLTDVPPTLAGLLVPCLLKDPAQRPTAAQLLERFAAATESYTPAARRNPDRIATMIMERGALAATWIMDEPVVDRARAGEPGAGRAEVDGPGAGRTPVDEPGRDAVPVGAPVVDPDPVDERLRGALLAEAADAMGALYARRASADRIVPVVLPALPGELARADRVTVVRWHRRPGDTVAAGETLLSVTDGRQRARVVSPVAGELRETGPVAGGTVRVGDPVAVLRRPKAAASAARDPKSSKGPKDLRAKAKPKPQAKAATKAPAKSGAAKGPKSTQGPHAKPTPKPGPTAPPKPTPSSATTAPQSGGDGAGCLGWIALVLIAGFVLYSTVHSQDIFTAEAGDCVRIEDGGKGTAYVEPCDFPVPWDKTYKVLSVDAPGCVGGVALGWTSDDKQEAINLCLQEIDPWG
ncbi:protein kinase domain-containing protein [Streptomyces uncialis]|uniref:serine/threonine protein kinase n=1 Tax=Streptomyces uncialis TaxID=1048205 RepID=UPI0038700F05|nr:protein kinase [Streptomyces uncialis]